MLIIKNNVPQIYTFQLNTTDFNSLKEQLLQSYNFPVVYVFKFIAPANSVSYHKLKALFAQEASLSEKESSGGKYVSITAKELMLTVDEIINRYKAAAQIEGVISL